QVDSDSGITTEEQIYQLIDAKLRCDLNISAQDSEDDLCPADWDGLVCWPGGSPGEVTRVSCPSYIYDFNHKGYAYRKCDANGSWEFVENNLTWPNYSDCAKFLHPGLEGEKGVTCHINNFTVVIRLSEQYIIPNTPCSQRLHCTRNYIHMHLFVSFMLRAIIIFIKDRVVHANITLQDFDSAAMDDYKTLSLAQVLNKTQYIGCKITVLLFIYFLATNYYWILVEGLYLHSLIFMAFLSDIEYLWGFTLIGWGVPALFVAAWAVVRATVADARCWELSAGNLKWIYQAPILIAIGLNFILFLNIVRVLATKIRETNAGRYDTRKQYRKLAKSTLVLVLVFGVHYIVFVGMPHTFNRMGWEVRMYCELFFNSFQVQTEIKKTWTRWNLALDWKRTPLFSSYRYGSVLTNLNNSTSSQSQLARASRTALFSSRVYRSGPSRAINSHTTLPGYVISNSDPDSMPPSIPEESDGNEEKQVEDISLKEQLQPTMTSSSCVEDDEAAL
ncbi:UNVERIFIED_CONTAM: hypothetical protein FKN15_002147, partial [Acipenser sinensis]